MTKLGIIVTDATKVTGSIVTAERLESANPAAPTCAEKTTVDGNWRRKDAS
jgi:hypothetical protein